MNRLQAVSLIVSAAVVIAGFAFESGRHFESLYKAKKRARNDPTSEGPITVASPVAIDKVISENIFAVPFSELCDQLRSASPERLLVLANEVEGLPDSLQRGAARFTFYKLLVQINPGIAAKLVEELKNDTDTLHVVVQAAPQSAMEAMAKMLIRLPGEITNTHYRGDYLSQVLWKWSRVDPEAAARFVDQNSVDGLSDYISSVIENWATFDPDAALAWLDRQDQSRLGPDPLERFLRGWFQSDPDAATRFTIAHASDERFDFAASNLAAAVFVRSSDAARDFVRAMPTDKAKKDALSSVVGTAQGLPAYVTEEETQPPEKVANWLLQFPADLWTGCMSSLTTYWRRDDPPRLFDWMLRLPSDVQKTVVEGYSFSYSSMPEEMGRDIEATMTVSNPTLRKNLLRQLAQKLGSTPQEAMETLHKTKLGVNEKKYMARLIFEQ